MCGRGRLFPDTEQPPQNAPHAAGRTPHHDLHALTSCHASTPRRRRSAETPPETSGTPPETRRRSGCPAPAPARRSPETSFRRHIVARYIPPLLQYMKERTRRAWRGGTSGTPSSTRGSTYRPVGRGPRAPPKNAYPAAGHMGPALQVHTSAKTTRRPLRDAARFPSMCGTDGGGLYSPLLQAGTALSTLIWKRRCTRCRCRELRKRPCSRRRRSCREDSRWHCRTGRSSQTCRP